LFVPVVHGSTSFGGDEVKGAPAPAEYATPPLRDMLFALINERMKEQEKEVVSFGDWLERVISPRESPEVLLQHAADAVRDLEDYWREDAGTI
jgi:hypothetical protein